MNIIHRVATLTLLSTMMASTQIVAVHLSIIQQEQPELAQAPQNPITVANTDQNFTKTNDNDNNHVTNEAENADDPHLDAVVNIKVDGETTLEPADEPTED